jgi:hypothetical protein
MKQVLIKVFWPLLRIFETGEEAVGYKKSHRVILIIMGVLFLGLSFGSAWAGHVSDELGALIPVVVFFGLGFVAVMLGTLGSNAAVCKIWGPKK